MYIEFTLATSTMGREIAQQILTNELRKWCRQHNINYSSLEFELVAGWNKQRVKLPNPRVYELFCISWAPANGYFERYSLRRD